MLTKLLLSQACELRLSQSRDFTEELWDCGAVGWLSLMVTCWRQSLGNSGGVFRYGTDRESSGRWQYALGQNFGSSAGILTAAIKA